MANENAQILQEFLVSLGFSLDDTGYQKLDGTLGKILKSSVSVSKGVVGIMAAAKLNGYVAKQHSTTHLAPSNDFVAKLPEGTDPAEFMCVMFEVKKDRREVELARGRINISTGTHKNAIPFESEKLAKQIYRLKFEVLKRGEYGLLPPGANISANATSAGKVYTFLVE